MLTDYTEAVDEPHEANTVLRHASWGAPRCDGQLTAMIAGDRAVIVCGECGHIVVRVAAADLAATLHRMQNTRLTTMPHSSFGDDDLLRLPRSDVNMCCAGEARYDDGCDTMTRFWFAELVSPVRLYPDERSYR